MVDLNPKWEKTIVKRGVIIFASSDPRVGLTLGELEEVVRISRQTGYSTDGRITVTVGFRGQIKQLTVTGEVD